MAQLISNASVPFYYVIPAVASLAPTANASSNITFDADSRFTWYKTTYFCDIAGAAITDGNQPIPMLTITMTDTGSSRQFSSLALPLDIPIFLSFFTALKSIFKCVACRLS
jgi:hypothetical protein